MCPLVCFVIVPWIFGLLSAIPRNPSIGSIDLRATDSELCASLTKCQVMSSLLQCFLATLCEMCPCLHFDYLSSMDACSPHTES